MGEQRRTVFISYSWDGETHQEWVLKLADDLTERYGLIVLLDQYDLTVGKNMTAFMEKSLEAADKVLIILTPNYKTKAEDRRGGAGFEHSIISQELYDLQDQNDKYLPVLRAGTTQTSAPGYIKTLVYRSMVNDNQYESDLLKLVKDIYGKPQAVRPQPGKIPNFDQIEELDPLVERANKLRNEEQSEYERIHFLNSQQAKNTADYSVNQLFSNIDLKAAKYRDATDFRFNLEKAYDKAILYSGEGYSIRYRWIIQYSNSVEGAELVIEYIDGAPSLDNSGYYFPGDEPKRLKLERYSFDVDKNSNPQWNKKDDNTTYRSEDIIKNSFVWLFDKIEEARRAMLAERRKRGF
ncbi:toll/interleukin-1 receptor domain-containing protein [Spirosoma pomorum]